MKHLILGAGNLGKDLFIELGTKPEFERKLLSASDGYDFSDLQVVQETLEEERPDVVWYCVGGGSVAEAKSKDNEVSRRSFLLNCQVPIFLREALPAEKKLVLFSSDYAADERRPSSNRNLSHYLRSQYAAQKSVMEREILRSKQPRTTIVRVGSLYGTHKPDKTFPGKIIKNFGFNQERIVLPSNVVTPTPTRWLAAVLVRGFDDLCIEDTATLEHVAPEGGITVKDWAKFVLEDLRGDEAFDRTEAYLDPERPLISNLRNSLPGSVPVHWFELWRTYFRKEWFFPKGLRGQPPRAPLNQRVDSLT